MRIGGLAAGMPQHHCDQRQRARLMATKLGDQLMPCQHESSVSLSLPESFAPHHSDGSCAVELKPAFCQQIAEKLQRPLAGAGAVCLMSSSQRLHWIDHNSPALADPNNVG